MPAMVAPGCAFRCPLRVRNPLDGGCAVQTGGDVPSHRFFARYGDGATAAFAIAHRISAGGWVRVIQSSPCASCPARNHLCAGARLRGMSRQVLRACSSFEVSADWVSTPVSRVGKSSHQRRSPNMAPQLLNLGRGRTDHALAKIGNQVLLAVVAVDLQEPPVRGGRGRTCLAPPASSRMMGSPAPRGDWARWCELLQHAFGIGDVCNDEPGHARKQRDRLTSVSACWALEIERYRQAATVAQLVP